MSAGRPKSIDNTKVFDVAKPNKSKPMGTSRPVIVSHAAPIKDATVVDVTGEEEKPAVLSAPSVTRKILMPMEKDDAQIASKSSITVVSEPSEEEKVTTAPVVVKNTTEESTDTSKVEDAAENVSDKNIDTIEPPVSTNSEASADDETATTEPEAVEESTEPEASTYETDTASTEPDADEEKMEESNAEVGSEAASVDALADASMKPKEDQKKAEEDAKKEAALQGLIDTKKYFVPLAHDSTSQKGGSGVWIALLVIILLAAGAYAAIDAKLIKTNISLPYHLFKQ